MLKHFTTTLIGAGILSFCSLNAAQAVQLLPTPTNRLQTIAIGSCLDAAKSLAILDVITEARPDVFIFGGDNVYAADESDDPALASLQAAYQALAHAPKFQKLARNIPILATWDDHDYGLNDAGADFAYQAQSERLFESFWQIASEDPSASRPGIYRAVMIGEGAQRVQIVLLDTRFFRTALKTPWIPPLVGRYIPTDDPKQSMLGAAQWQWLTETLAEPAALRILVSSVQVLADGHQWEAWRMLPREQQRLLELLATTTGETIIVSGDRHLAALYQAQAGEAQSVLELTTSSLNLPLSQIATVITEETGSTLLDSAFYEANFGWIEIDWAARIAQIEIRNEQNEPVRQRAVSF
ncbi:MAG: alkaline phosphatase D family protein [Pseudomonadales bacterium]|nr:alkaline phosphatase D family protein [Pseudomonadales bacterium]